MSGHAVTVPDPAAGLTGALAELADRPLRLAMFSPMPPAPTGIADYTAGLLDVLPERWEIDVFAEEHLREDKWIGRRQRLLPHTQRRRRQRMRPYDLAIYHVGNSETFHYPIPLVRRQPGLLVLHDAVLHPSRAAHHLRAHDLDGYRAALQRGRPDVASDARPEDNHFGYERISVITIRFWFATLLLAMPFMLWCFTIRQRSRRYRLRRGLCPSCSYDMRGTMGSCPECGHVRP